MVFLQHLNISYLCYIYFVSQCAHILGPWQNQLVTVQLSVMRGCMGIVHRCIVHTCAGLTLSLR